ncbi:MAG: DUF502 domain-containing protein [Deltaproteobacteria bacterium]|nr:DUF502 domain-containing protein [Deltaproteobacteria bacterium]
MSLGPEVSGGGGTASASKDATGFFPTLKKNFRNHFVAGLLVIVPLWLTFLVLRFMVRMMDRALLILPDRWHPQHLIGFHVPGAGVVLTVFLVLVVGFTARNLVGRRLVAAVDTLFERTPLVRKVYAAFKQFTLTVLGGTQEHFHRAVVVEYPREGIYTIGFVTNRLPAGRLERGRAGRYIAVFLPTTPNPTSGWVSLFPEADVMPLDMSVEDAFKIVISGGVVMPADNTAVRALTEPVGAPAQPTE